MFALLASIQSGGGDMIHFAVGFVVLVVVLAIVVIAVRWLLGLMGIAIPQPLMVIIGLFFFLIFLLMLLNWSGYYRF